MGRDVSAITVTEDKRRRYRDKVQRCLEAFAAMLRDSRFESEPPTVGVEIEVNLVDGTGRAAMRNEAVLASIADPLWSTELAKFNLELNQPPAELRGKSLAVLEQGIRDNLGHADARARNEDAALVIIGILPTLLQSEASESALSGNPRYRLLNEQILAARGDLPHLDIDGVERLRAGTDSIAPEAACTSTQFHLCVGPDDFAAYWNASQAVCGVQVALAANSPFLFGRELWRETRIPLFEQATDTRTREQRRRPGVRPRVWFGERWIDSIFDLFEENTRYFSALLPLCEDDDPLDQLARGRVPELAELSLHNGTIYRWNRPVYDVGKGRPHLRVENRVVPAGPTVADTMANAAFYYGLIRALAEDDPPVWEGMPFAAAATNLRAGARYGIDAPVFWPGLGELPATDLVLRRLLPKAATGLDRWGVDAVVRDRLLGIIERRCVTRRNGAVWQAETVHASRADRFEALRLMVLRYLEHMHTNAPVHTWPIGS